MSLNNFKTIAWSLSWLILLSLVLFSAQQFFSGLNFFVNPILVAVIFFSLKKSSARWPLTILGGWLLDAVCGTYFFNLAVLGSLTFFISYFTGYISLDNYLARWLLIIGSVAASLALFYLFALVFALLDGNAYQYLIFLSSGEIVSYLILNSLAVFLSLVLFKKLTLGKYAQFS